MGIPKYHKWLTDRYPQAFSEKPKESAEHVYVDINALLHDVMRHANGRDSFFFELFRKLDRTFQAIAPTRSVFLAVDGPASCAKCLTQRERRRQHLEKDSHRAGKGGKSKGKGKPASGAEQLSNNMLTPGVPFMAEVTSALEYYAAARMAPGQPLAGCAAATVSGAHAVGEGEHKIVGQILRHAGAGGAAASEAHVIVSGDADIFLLSLVQSAARRVRVVSERPAVGGGGGGGAQKRKRRGGPVLTVWDSEVLARLVAAELPARQPGRGPGAPADEVAVRRDFALVSLLAGNDYLPPLSCGLAPQQLWDGYLKLRRQKYQQQSLIVTGAVEGGLPLSHLAGGWAPALGDHGAAFAAEPFVQFFYHAPLLADLMGLAAAGAPERAGGGLAAEGAGKYLAGLLWILTMYHHGYCCDFYFVFETKLRPFASASLIVQHLPGLLADAPIEAPMCESPPMRPLACALCILPVQHAERFLCPVVPELRAMFAPDHPLLGDVNSRELSTDARVYKAHLAALQQQLMSLRSLGRDETQVKAQLALFSKRMEGMNKATSDIDVVPLWEVDAEVAQRCEGRQVDVLNFAPDVTLLRGAAGAASSPPLSLRPPVRSMGPAHSAGLRREVGEWPPAPAAAAAVGGDEEDEGEGGGEGECVVLLDEEGEEEEGEVQLQEEDIAEEEEVWEVAEDNGVVELELEEDPQAEEYAYGAEAAQEEGLEGSWEEAPEAVVLDE